MDACGDEQRIAVCAVANGVIRELWLMAKDCWLVGVIVGGDVFNMVCGCGRGIFLAGGFLYVGSGTLFSSVCLEIVEKWWQDDVLWPIFVISDMYVSCCVASFVFLSREEVWRWPRKRSSQKIREFISMGSAEDSLIYCGELDL